MKRTSFIIAAIVMTWILSTTGAWAAGKVDPVTTRLAALEAAVATLQNTVATLQTRVASLETQVAGLQSANAALNYLSVETGTINGLKGPHVIFSGANVHIRNGSGNTSDNGTVGLGNLIIGYNEQDNTSQLRTGSHNLVMGQWNSFTSYSGYVNGVYNTIGSGFASIFGGFYNTASNIHSMVITGTTNTASGYASFVGGGSYNTASGDGTTICGGYSNTASGGGVTICHDAP